MIACIDFLPDKVVPSTLSLYQQYYDKVWGQYGFINAFNVKDNWYDLDYIGIDQGNLILSVENFKNGAVWEEFMSNKYIRNGLMKAGFYIKK
jgi:hypothetical protein